MPAPNLNLTRYWRRKRTAIQQFLALPPKDPSPTSRDLKTLTDWFNGMIQPDGGDSLEAQLNTALGTLKSAKDTATGSPDDINRRSARLVALVQGATGSAPDKNAYFLGVADAGYPTDVKDLQSAVRDASVAAARFLNAAKNKQASGINSVWLALRALIAANPQADQLILDELSGLAAAMEPLVSRVGGAEIPPDPWPSNFVSSSSSSGS